MSILSDFSTFRVVRLNANLFPITESEAELYGKYHFEILEAEANEPEESIPHVVECDALFAVSVALPGACDWRSLSVSSDLQAGSRD